MNRPTIRSLETSVAYQKNPLATYEALTQLKNATMLFESADINHQHALKSLAIIDSSLRITARDELLFVDALTLSGQVVLAYLCDLFSHELQTNTENSATFRFPRATIQQRSHLDILRAIQKLADPNINNEYSCFLGGLFGYDLVGVFRGITIPEANRVNDLIVYLAETMIVVDHVTKTARLQSNVISPNDASSQQDTQANNAAVETRFAELTQQLSLSIPDLVSPKSTHEEKRVEEEPEDEFITAVKELKVRIDAGEFSQIVPSRKFRIPCENPLAAYEVLKKSHPSPYLFYMQDQDLTLFGASPESALKFNHTTRELQLYPIAGTRPRGRKNGEINLELDKALEAELRTDKKEVAEHEMLVDLAEEELAVISDIGTVEVKEKMKVDRYAYVMHLVSRVTSTLKSELDALDAYISTMNMGTLTGSPKDHAMETIYHYEKEARGAYGGGIGYIDGFGNLDTCIVIRSAMVKDGVATIQAGAGIVRDSKPELELEETRNKANSVIRAIMEI